MLLKVQTQLQLPIVAFRLVFFPSSPPSLLALRMDYINVQTVGRSDSLTLFSTISSVFLHLKHKATGTPKSPQDLLLEGREDLTEAMKDIKRCSPYELETHLISPSDLRRLRDFHEDCDILQLDILEDIKTMGPKQFKTVHTAALKNSRACRKCRIAARAISSNFDHLAISNEDPSSVVASILTDDPELTFSQTSILARKAKRSAAKALRTNPTNSRAATTATESENGTYDARSVADSTTPLQSSAHRPSDI
ncbi:hypothetical protein BDQ12DRAFT_734796 [Crucibulum laeve]|uniref:Uncharacterized protein n=1 Tax=Crucibulum laeve TaxID=68775 RepID=A0A5C3M4X7_9AGAR|nr:hypothetical protein BDQ12DRAFT_734796 [Crucibulum laeve]